MQYTLARPIPTHSTFTASLKYPPSVEIWRLDCGWVNQLAKIMLAMQMISHPVEYITRQLVSSDAVHTTACTGIKKCP